MATSPAPYGIGLDTARFWLLTPREYEAIRYRWADHQALTHSAHFADGGVPFVPEDFLYSRHRQQRIAQSKKDRLAVMIENRKTGMGDDSGELPEWAAWHVRKVN